MAGNEMAALIRGWSRVPGKIRTIKRLANGGSRRTRKRKRRQPWTLYTALRELLLLPFRLLALALWIGLLAFFTTQVFS